MTENTATVEATETEYTAQENRRYARKQANKAVNLMYGRSGMTKAEKLARLNEAVEHLNAAKAALEKAFHQVYEKPDTAPANDGQIEVLEHIKQPEADMDADELEAYAASF